MLGVHGTPLLQGDIKAFQFGPVLPELYDELRNFGRGCVEAIPTTETGSLFDEQVQIIDSVWKYYGNKSGSQLSALTHRVGTPWHQVWNKTRFGLISNDLIADHYRKLLG